MKKLYFINLAVDHLWDSENQLTTLFTARVPRSEDIVRTNEDLALYLCEEDDIAIIYSNAPHTSKHKNLIAINANPFNTEDWLAEVATKLKLSEGYELWPVSISTVEQGLLKIFPQLKLAPWLPQNFPAGEVNRKSLLPMWSFISGLKIPPTTQLKIQEIMNDSFFEASDFPFFLKAEWGSGGGANFLIHDPMDPALKIIRRQLAGQTAGNWIKQKFIPSSSDFSVFGWANNSLPQVMKIAYDDRGQSIEHQWIAPETKIDFTKTFIEPFQKISQYLNHKYSYYGPFGLDLIEDNQGQVFLVDVNIRWTKTHLIMAAADKLKVDLNTFVSRREKHPTEDFLDTHKNQIIPYLYAGHLVGKNSVSEVNFFQKKNPN